MYYDYEQEVKDDVREWIEENINIEDYSDSDELKDYLNNTLWAEDSVTGNGSGSYTFNRAKASEYLSQNFDLLYEVLENFGSFESLKEGPEACDVAIRCYLLPDAIESVVDAMED